MNTADNRTSDPTQAIQSPLAPPFSGTAVNRNNNFNLLRLLLATLVLLSHSPELVDGDRHREILTRLFHTLSFGELAVDGFFLLSGFLIVQSWQHNPELLGFLRKRFLRIYPAFIVASLIAAFVVGPLGSDTTQYFAHFDLLQFLKGMASLATPIVPPVFDGQHYPSVNGAMWTIAYEFQCYLLVALFGFFGIVGRRQVWLTLSAIILFFSALLIDFTYSSYLLLSADFVTLIRFFAFFYAGGCFYLFRDRIRYKMRWVLIAAVILFLCMFWMKTAQFALATVGAYILFWFAFAQFPFLERFRTYPDISYGVYLYGWPSQKLLLWYIPSLSPWLLFPLACGLSGICGLLSWHLVEYPFLHLKRRRDQKDATNVNG